jgi:hypothetical protein
VKLKQIIKENAKRDTENVSLKAELEKNKVDTANLVVENAELRDRVTKDSCKMIILLITVRLTSIPCIRA